MKNALTRFVLNLMIFILIPVTILSLVFFIFDPFLIFLGSDASEEIKDYYSKKCRVGTNLEHVSLVNLSHQMKKREINSFIFGSSRAGAFDRSYWESSYLSPDDNAFLLNAAGDSLEGMKRKLTYLDKKNVNIKNVIITFDLDSLRQKEKEPFLLIDSPLVVESIEKKAMFYLQHVKTFFNPKFLFPLALSKISKGKICNTDFNTFVLNSKAITFDSRTNNRFFHEVEKQIDEDPNNFYKTPSLLSQFKKQRTRTLPSVLSDRQEGFLIKIAEIFKKHKTNYKVVIHPGWQTEYLHPKDLTLINDIFGESNTFDLTLNNWNRKRENWYDEKHPRPHVTKEIISLLYKGN